MRKKPQPDFGKPVKIALSGGQFATVSEVDWGFAFYYGNWRLKRGQPSCRGVTLGEFIAKRAGLDVAIAVAFKDGNPLNCVRDNVFTTRYVWARGVVRRRVEDDERKTSWVRTPGWTYGNVGLCRIRADHWSAIHLPSGLALGASWAKLKDAMHGIEMIHSAGNLTNLDRYHKFKPGESNKWRKIVTRFREGW